jgi:hypothetical protein
MKNIVLALMLIFGFASFSFAGDCVNGVCRAPVVQPVRKVVNVTKNIVLAPVRAVVAVATPVSTNCCETVVATDSCDCGCSNSVKTKEVVKYQPLRRRLVNRTTNVICGCQ